MAAPIMPPTAKPMSQSEAGAPGQATGSSERPTKMPTTYNQAPTPARIATSSHEPRERSHPPRIPSGTTAAPRDVRRGTPGWALPVRRATPTWAAMKTTRIQVTLASQSRFVAVRL